MDLSNEILKRNFNVDRYLGDWFEIAKTPNFFEVGCESAKAKYGKRTDTILTVLNTCLGEDGDPKTRTCEEAGGIGCRGLNNTVPPRIRGTAQAVDPRIPAALHVSFPSSEFDMANKDVPNYLVHDTDYKIYAVVGDPSRKFLFILARKKYMSAELFNAIVEFAAKLGYDTDSIIINTRNGEPVVV